MLHRTFIRLQVGHDVHTVMTLLSAHLLDDACTEAQESGEHRLALLIAQASTSSLVRQLLKKQLADWHQTQVRPHDAVSTVTTPILTWVEKTPLK